MPRWLARPTALLLLLVSLQHSAQLAARAQDDDCTINVQTPDGVRRLAVRASRSANELLHASRQFAREHGLTLRDLCTNDTKCVVRQLDALEADCQSASADILADAARDAAAPALRITFPPQFHTVEASVRPAASCRSMCSSTSAARRAAAGGRCPPRRGCGWTARRSVRWQCVRR